MGWVTRLRWHLWVRTLTSLMALVGLASPVLAADKASIASEKLERLLLKVPLTGLIGASVSVGNMNPEAEKDGLAKSTIQTDVELRLRQAGIRVLDYLEWKATPGEPDLFLSIGTTKLKGGMMYGYSIQLSLFERVRLARDPNKTVTAITWDTESGGNIPTERLSELRTVVRDMVDEFINAYLAANPKR